MMLQNRYRSLQQINPMYKMAFSGKISQKIQSRSLTSIKLNKQELPKQPVPDLIETARKYLRSVKPLLNDKEYSNTENVVADFIKKDGIGFKLQEKLLKRYENTESWMNEWFLHSAYLGYRDSVLLMSSPGTVGPPQKFTSITEFQKFAAQLIVAVSNYNNLVKSGNIKPEMVGTTPLDMQPYAMILGTHRQPGVKTDKLIHTDNSTHIIIIRNNNIFKLNITNSDGSSLTERKIIPAIKDILERSENSGIPVGILSGNQRDQWAQDFQVLKNIGKNSQYIEDIENALFVLCLDKELPLNDFQLKNNLSIRGKQALTGYSIESNAGNRWHDKTLQFIISPDGFVGTEYEHSPCEGGPIGVIQDFILKYVENEKQKFSEQKEEQIDFPRGEKLEFEINDSIQKSIQDATKFVQGMCNKIDLECFKFENFGTTKIKKSKLSPDSFIQTAMQVAFFRLHGKPPAHYESGGLRRFKNTRTEAIRSTSIESVEFAKLMTLSESSKHEKKEAMLQAISAHKRIAGEAVTGSGVDRHLYGLKMIAITEKLDLPELFKDIGYTISTSWTLTSSQVPFKSESFMCYGPVVENGYGCCYNPRPEDIFIACSSFTSCKDTFVNKFAAEVRKALCDMQELTEN